MLPANWWKTTDKKPNRKKQKQSNLVSDVSKEKISRVEQGID
jgi:hypothetical protein